MVKFCSKCGSKIDDDSAKFCPKCGAVSKVDETEKSSSSSGIKCLYCGKEIPIGGDKCLYCGKYINPKANKKHNAAIVVGYVLLFVPILSFVPLIIGIYLLTRPNKKVHKHGIIMIVLSIISCIIWFFILIAMSTPSYNDYYYRPSHYSSSYDYNYY